jgi:DNA-directed RNA polymerase subunit RPC12/RpoP
MKTISCGSCGMQYDGSGLQAGVQFQCTQCGSMVLVGGGRAPAAPGKGRGGTRAAGPQPAAAPRGPQPAARAKAGMPRGPRAAAGAPGAQQERQVYAAPKKSNAGVFVAVGIGVVVVGLIIAIVVFSSKPSPQEQQQTAQKSKQQEQKEKLAKLDAETEQKNAALTKTIKAAEDLAPAIEAALRNGDGKVLEGMFDWTVYALYVKSLWDADEEKIKGGGDKGLFRNSPLIATGTWAKGEDGRYTGKYDAVAPHGPDSLRDRLMGYLGNFVFQAPELAMDRDKTFAALEKTGLALEIGGTKYIGRKVFITFKGDGGTAKEFWVGAPEGTDNVKIINYFDKGASKKIAEKEAKNPKTDDRDPSNPDRNPENPDRNPTDPENPDNPDGMEETGMELPPLAKTNAMPTDAALENIIKDIKRGAFPNDVRLKNISGQPNRAEKKAVFGALIDCLIDAHTADDRNTKVRVSEILLSQFGARKYAEWSDEDLTFSMQFGVDQEGGDNICRRWLLLYKEYE